MWKKILTWWCHSAMRRRKTTRIRMETIVTGPAATDEHAARSHGSQAAHEPAEKAGDGGDV